jgi:transposase
VAKLSKDAIVTIQILNQHGESHCGIARRLRVSEGTVRYHLKRAAMAAIDGRDKESLIVQRGLAEVVRAWWTAESEALPEGRPPSGEALWEFLRLEHAYSGSCKSVRKYLRAHFPRPKLRPFRRIETPPGAQCQTDWGDFPLVDIGDPGGPVTLHAFVMVLSHSRKAAVVWCRRMDQLSWHHAHNQALTRLGGVPAANRIDNLKTGIARGAGAWGEINRQYRTYAQTMGFHIDACEAEAPQQKGKVERRVSMLRTLGVERRCYASLEHLQDWTDEKLRLGEQTRLCPATGGTIADSWAQERPLLRALPALMPEPFDLVKTVTVAKDCTVRFEGRSYVVPFAHVGSQIEVRGCCRMVQAVDPATGAVLRSYPRQTSERILIDPSCYDGPETDRVLPPQPLGAMARKLEEISRMSVQLRSVEIYAELAEVAR